MFNNVKDIRFSTENFRRTSIPEVIKRVAVLSSVVYLIRAVPSIKVTN